MVERHLDKCVHSGRHIDTDILDKPQNRATNIMPGRISCDMGLKECDLTTP